MNILDIARLFLHVRELPGNRGARVEAIQRYCGANPGDSWCACFVSVVLDLYYGGQAPFARTASCDEILALATDKRLIVQSPIPGDLYLRLNDPTDAHHVGFVSTAVRTVLGHDIFGQISGNTSADGVSSNGDGVYERDVALPVPEKIAFVRLPER